MSYSFRTTSSIQVTPEAIYTVTKNNVVNAVVLGPFNVYWFACVIVTDADWDGSVLLNYIAVDGSLQGIVQDNGPSSVNRANMVSFLGAGGGSWGVASGATRPQVDILGRLTINATVFAQATKGSAKIIVRYLT